MPSTSRASSTGWSGGRADAEAAYRATSRAGRRPEPGLSLLRLAQGRIDAATASLRRELDETHDRLARPRLLAAYVEVLLAAGASMRLASRPRSWMRSRPRSALRCCGPWRPGRTAPSCLAAGDAQGSLAALRRSWEAWQDLDAPYEAARVRLLIGRSCRALGDEDTARLEFDAAAERLPGARRPTGYRRGGRTRACGGADTGRPDRS